MRLTKSLTTLLFSFLLTLSTAVALASESNDIQQDSIHFKSIDGLLITADLYLAHKPASPLIVLFHQAGSSRGEYIEIAPRLNKLGFNCLAADLRSGEYSRGKDNETAIRAGKAGLASSYADALPDVIATLQYARKNYPHSKIIAWGSSYSAALVLKVAGDAPSLTDGVISFSPGEYFAHVGKSKTWIQDSAKNIRVPIFITSSKNETGSWSAIYETIDKPNRHSFVPVTAGKHGSKALWEKYTDSPAYWDAVIEFLDSLNE